MDFNARQDKSLSYIFMNFVIEAAKHRDDKAYIEDNFDPDSEIVQFHEKLLNENKSYKDTFNEYATLGLKMDEQGIEDKFKEALSHPNALIANFKAAALYIRNFSKIRKLKRYEDKIENIFRTTP